MMLLDTHAWLEWCLKPEVLPSALRTVLASLDQSVAISVMSCYECALLVERERVALPIPIEEWMPQAIAENRLRVLPATPQFTIRAAQLPQIHRDPWDRLIIATALEYDAFLVTRDRTIPLYPDIRVFWEQMPI